MARWPLRHASLPDNNRQTSQKRSIFNEKNVFNGLVIILVWFGVNRSTFDEDMHAKRFLRFRFHCP